MTIAYKELMLKLDITIKGTSEDLENTILTCSNKHEV